MIIIGRKTFFSFFVLFFLLILIKFVVVGSWSMIAASLTSYLLVVLMTRRVCRARVCVEIVVESGFF